MDKLSYIGSPETIQVIKRNTTNMEKEKFKLMSNERMALNQLMTKNALIKRKFEQNKFLDKLMQEFKILDSGVNKKIMMGVIENTTAEIVKYC
jgi:hypothetical protein